MFSIRRLIILAICSAPLVGGQAAILMVNEYFNANGASTAGTKMATDEYIEFVVGERATAAALSALTFGDTSDATNALRSVFRFNEATLQQALANAGRSDFMPGTIIVVKGAALGPQDLNYRPVAGAGDDGWNIELVAGQGAIDHSETRINGNLSVGNAGEVVWVSTSNPPSNTTDFSGFISALGHDANPGLAANSAIAKFGGGVIWSGNVTTGSSVSNGGGGSAPGAIVSVGGTRGVANGGGNTIFVTSLRTASLLVTVPEPSRAALLLIGLGALFCPRRRRGASRT